VFWKNIDKQTKSLEKVIQYNIIYGVLGFLFVELLIYLAVTLTLRSLEQKVKVQASHIIESDWELNLSNNLISKIREGILVTDKNQKIIRSNQEAANITGYSQKELLGSTPKLFSSGQHAKEFYDDLWLSVNFQGFWEGDIFNRKKTGELFVSSVTISVVKDKTGNTRNYMAVFTDVTHEKTHQRNLEKAAFSDPLTKLPNRMLLQDRLEQSLQLSKQNKQLTFCIFIDLDKFKPINDKFGHDAGDFVLVKLSERMLNVIRNQDTLARIGGDEFVAIINGLNSKGSCVELVFRLIKAINEPLNYKSKELQVSASFGISSYDSQVEITAEKLLKQADEAMYSAKTSLETDYIFYEEL